MTTSYRLEILTETADVSEPIEGLPPKDGELVKYIEAGDFDGAIREVVARFKSPEATRDYAKAAGLEVHYIFPIRAGPS
jgi:hypothetical protein